MAEPNVPDEEVVPNTSEDALPTTSEEAATPTGEIGEHIHRGTLNIVWGGVWVPLGDAEFLTHNGTVIKVISFTPREFPRGDQTSG